MVIKGMSENFHDAAVAIMHDDKLMFASSSERFSRVKNDRRICDELRKIPCDTHIFYEDWRLKNQRRQTYGQREVQYFEDIECVLHHESHMAAAYYTAPFVPDVTVVIDAIGEYDTASIWVNHEKVWSKQYPWSLGLFYSAITKRIGLKPNEDEYITMGMAAFGKPCVDMTGIFDEYLHTGIPLKKWFWNKPEDIAASAQLYLEDELQKIFVEARKYGNKVAYGGGVALNCVANSKIAKMFDKMWIFPNPGDAGSALGCILAKSKKRLDYTHTFWGYNIDRELNPNEVVKELLDSKVVGVANGRAEFGPRALGNRSLLADPRYNIKDKVNKIKRRQKFRPFAPAILEEHYNTYFEGYANEFMQFVCDAKHDYKSVVHVDGTSRVQIVKDDGSNLRKILECWYDVTDCPMLLNTSLNIKGQPIVNSWEHAEDFMRKYKVKVL
jgi:carbamoyltransferase